MAFAVEPYIFDWIFFGCPLFYVLFSTPSEASLINVAIKAREEQINLFFRAVATKRSEVNLKGGLEGLSI